MNKKNTTLLLMSLFASSANANYLSWIDPNYWTADNFKDLLIREIYKRADKPEQSNYWSIDSSTLNTAYRIHNGLQQDINRCRADKFNNNPSWVDGIKLPKKVENGVDTYYLAAGSNYILAQRDLAKRGKERLRDHYFSWVVTGENIVHNSRKEDPHLPYVFDKKHGVNSEIMIFNIAFNTDYNIGVSWGGSLNGDFSSNDSEFKAFFDKGDYLEKYSCSYYKVKFIENTAPRITSSINARAVHNPLRGLRSTPLAYILSIDVDDKETDSGYLSYSWRLNYKDGGTKLVNERTPTIGGAERNKIEKYTITVGDGEKFSTYVGVF